MALQALLLFLFCAIITVSTTQANPLPSSSSSTKRCKNAIVNPSFETPVLSPWMDMVTGSWSYRGIYTSSAGGHSGSNFYAATSNSSVVRATLTLSQSYIDIPTGSTVDCYAWVEGNRMSGRTRVEMFLDQVSCGEAVYMGPGKKGWTKVGGKTTVQSVAGGVGHSVALSVQGDGVENEEGWSVAVDDAGVMVGC